MTGMINTAAESLISETTMNDLFCCIICFNQFDETNHLPKLLSCHHTFCRRCLSMLYEQQQKLVCPVCAEECTVGKKGIDGLSTNYYLYKFTEMLNNLKLDQGTTSASLTESNNQETCKKHGNTVKYFWCVTCSVKICTHCIAVDHSFLKDHEIKDLGEAITSIQKDILNNIKSVKDKISKIKELQVKSEIKPTNMIKAIDILKNLYETPFKCFEDIFIGSHNPEEIMASVNQFCSSENFKYNPESLVTMKFHLEEVLSCYSSIEEFLEQKLKEMKQFCESRILFSVVRPEIAFDYGRIYCIRCGELCSQPHDMNIELKHSKKTCTRNVCKNCNITVLEFL